MTEPTTLSTDPLEDEMVGEMEEIDLQDPSPLTEDPAPASDDEEASAPAEPVPPPEGWFSSSPAHLPHSHPAHSSDPLEPVPSEEPAAIESTEALDTETADLMKQLRKSKQPEEEVGFLP